MARNGLGVMSVPYPDFQTGTEILDAEVDANNADIVSELTNSIPRDGQAAPTADIPFGTHKITGLGSGSAATDSANLGQVQASAYIWCGTAGGNADAITLNPSPTITDYAAGQRFTFVSSGDNTGAATVSVNGLTAKNVKKTNSGVAAALAAGDIKAGSVVNIVYDGTQFRIPDDIKTVRIGDIADDAVDTDTIADDAVTVDKLADNAVGTDQIADDAVTVAKLGADVVLGSSVKVASCSTASATAAKSVTISGYTPVAGDRIFVSFSNANTADAPTLTLNTVSYPIWSEFGLVVSATNPAYFPAFMAIEFLFDGTKFMFKRVVGRSYTLTSGSGTWYRIYTDGWIEQGQYESGKGDITFPIPHKNTAYHVNAQLIYGSDAFDRTIFITRTSGSAMNVKIGGYNQNNNYNGAFMWETKGY